MAIPEKQFFGESRFGWQCCVPPPTRLKLGLPGEQGQNIFFFALLNLKSTIAALAAYHNVLVNSFCFFKSDLGSHCLPYCNIKNEQSLLASF